MTPNYGTLEVRPAPKGFQARFSLTCMDSQIVCTAETKAMALAKLKANLLFLSLSGNSTLDRFGEQARQQIQRAASEGAVTANDLLTKELIDSAGWVDIKDAASAGVEAIHSCCYFSPNMLEDKAKNTPANRPCMVWVEDPAYVLAIANPKSQAELAITDFFNSLPPQIIQQLPADLWAYLSAYKPEAKNEN